MLKASPRLPGTPENNFGSAKPTAAARSAGGRTAIPDPTIRLASLGTTA